MRLTLRVFFLLLGWTAFRPIQIARAQSVCATPGKDGSTFTANPNTYYPGIGTATAGTRSIGVGTLRTGGNTTPIAKGDLLLIIQMQGADINNTNSTSYGSGTATGNGGGYLTSNLTAGQYEYVVADGAVGAVTPGAVPVTTNLLNTYTASATTATATRRTFQVVRVPQYTNLTMTANITPPAWDGGTGGIVAIDVQGNLNFGTFTIDASALGFRGGAGIKQAYLASNSRVDYLTAASTNAPTTAAANPSTQANGLNAQKGEGIAGSPRYVNVRNTTTFIDTGTDNYPSGSSGRGAPGNAGGGANDNGNNSGGGGGANGGTGGDGGYSSITATPNTGTTATTTSIVGGRPGAAFAATSSRLIMGGGGGAGTTNDGTGNAAANGFASSGAPGGGIVLVRTGTVSGTGGISANGGNAPTGVLNDGGGGGGAGGSILLTATGSQTGLAGLTMSAVGGTGASVNPGGGGGTAHGPGGGGGGGVVLTSGATKTTLAVSTAGGANGTTTPVGTGTGYNTAAFGATSGASGNGVSNASISNNIANSASGATCSNISGTIFDDSNYGGGAGRPYSTANTSATGSGLANNAIGSVGTTVELYDNTGALVATTTTTTGGAYSFVGVATGTAATTYTVRVVNSTVKSARTPGATGLVPVQTFRTTAYTGTGFGAATADPNRVGGEAPAGQDAAANSGSQTLAALTAGTATPQSITSVTPGTSGVDFGFNFDVVVNTNNAGQGSLRQFITNANALGSENLLAQSGSNAAGTLPAGTETSIFMIPNGTARPGLLASGSGGPASQLNTSGVAVISPTAILPTITGVLTSIDGTTQTFNIGNTNSGVLGTGGTVGTGATALSTVNRPEVQLVGTRAFDGVVVGATSAIVRGLSLYGFDHNVTVNTDITAFLIEQNVIGTSATSFTDPGVGVRTLNEGVLLNNADNGIVRNNLAGFNGGMGVWVQGFGNGSNGNLISNNEIRGNGQESRPAPEGLVFDGLELQGASTSNTVSGNLITANYGHGIDNFGNTIGGNTVSGNTISNNGVGVATNTGEEGSGLRLFSATNLTRITNNVLSGNNGSGVLVSGSGNNITISQNSTFGNTRLGIDLISETGAPVFYNGQTGTTSNVTINDSGDGDTGGNGLLNYPVITRATLTGSGLLVEGFARPGSTIELFAADNAANSVAANAGFGQGRTFLGTFTEGGTTGTSPDTNTGTGTYGPGAINGLSQGTDNTAAFSFLIPLTGNFAGLAAGTTLTSTATLNNSTSEFSGNATLSALSGYVYEDVNYGGGAGRPRSASGTVGRPGATVELYSGTTLVGTTTTDTNGQYTFGTTPGTYTVRVVNSSVSSSRPGYVTSVLPVQTYNGTTTAVGGVNPAFTDAAANTGSQSLTALTSGTTTPQSIATVTTTNAAATGPDFGYNFDVVVNTNDAGQGSLRQFILNANALGSENLLTQAGSNNNGALPAGVETSIFMIPSGQLSSGVAAIALASALPAITGVNTSIDGTTQTINIGNTNNVTLGLGGTVGTAATALSQLNGPEVQLKGNNSFNGLSLTANNTTVRGLSLYGFDTNIVGGPSNTGTLIEQNVIGASATSFTDPGGTNRTLNEGIDLNGSDNGIVRNNLIGFNGGMGIWVANSFDDANNGANGNTISNNEIRSNALLTIAGNGERLVYDGIELQGSSTGNTVSGNLITGNTGHGIDSFDNNIGGNTITDNTISNNGQGVANNTGEEGSGLRIFGVTNPTIVSSNVLSGNNGSGVLVIGSANQVIISQNSTFGNTRLGIDLLSAAEGTYSTSQSTIYWNGQTGATSNVSLNDNGDGDTGGNGLLNFPVITSATILNGNLVVQGFARPGSAIELFTPSSTANGVAANVGFGQGQTYLGTFTEGSGADTDNGTGTYSGTINGLNQGTDNTSRFSFTIPLAGRFAAYVAGSQLTSTATLNGATSEFSGNVTVTSALTGYVFEDVNYGGGAGRPRSASGAVVRPGARVELYDANDTFVSATTTDATGQYAFNVPAATYTVRVVNNTVSSSRTGSVAGLLPVQTYNGTTTAVGGVSPAKVDAGNGASGTTLASLNTATTIAESQATVTLGTGTTAGPDFGYNFDVVVNTNDAGQGSLRQFILNANALGGENLLTQAGSNNNGALPAGVETSIFMIPNGAARPGLLASGSGGPASQLTNGVAAIALTSTLANISGTNAANTSLDGSTQTFNIGNTNATVTTAGSESTGPEVVINFNNTNGFGTSAANTRIIGLGLTGANSGAGSGAAALRIDNGASNSLILNNTFYSNGANFRLSSVSGVTVTGNISRNATFADSDGIEISSASNSTITNNQFLNNAGFGIDFINGTSSNNTLTGNTFSGNGQNTTNGQTAGIGLRDGSSNNTITGNTFTNNVGDGITATAGSGNTFSQNSFYGNGNLAIDLANGGALNGDGVTLNDSGDGDTGGNGLLNFPVITSATILNGNLVVQGFARPGSAIELYNPGPAADPTNFGEGQTYLGTFTEGGAADTDNGTGTYSGTQPNGLNEGSDNTNRFSFTIPLTGRFAGYTFNSLLSSTATLSGSTSEFGGNVRVITAPVPNNATNASIGGGTASPVALNPSLSGTAYGNTQNVTTNTTNTISYYTITSLPTSGTLYYNGTALTSSTIATTQVVNPAQLSYQPASGFTGNATFAYIATDADGLTSTTHNTSGTINNGPATYTIPVSAPLPVVLTDFTAQAVQNRDAQLSWHTASERNNDHFEIERSFDGTTFTKIGRVAGQGTTTSATVYAFTDANVAAKASGPVYYRLRQVDRDGTATYSPLRTVSFTKAAIVSLSVYPNPVATRTNLDLGQLPATGTYQVVLLDATGRQVQTWTLLGGATHPLDVAGLASGSYLLVVTGQQPDGSLLKQTMRLTKE